MGVFKSRRSKNVYSIICSIGKIVDVPLWFPVSWWLACRSPTFVRRSGWPSSISCQIIAVINRKSILFFSNAISNDTLRATYSTWGKSVSAAPTDDDIITATEKNKQINADDVIVVDADFPGRASLLWALVNNAVQRNPEQGVPLISLISFSFAPQQHWLSYF
jgi:hypothetical protein